MQGHWERCARGEAHAAGRDHLDGFIAACAPVIAGPRVELKRSQQRQAHKLMHMAKEKKVHRVNGEYGTVAKTYPVPRKRQRVKKHEDTPSNALFGLFGAFRLRASLGPQTLIFQSNRSSGGLFLQVRSLGFW